MSTGVQTKHFEDGTRPPFIPIVELLPNSYLDRCCLLRTPISIDVVSATRDSRELKDLAALGLCLLAER